ncbi:putative sulfate transporter [Trifolium pratense]|uniref:Putative sulfate transporter n=1 Tax=Trifolium pratense TaxID=57577 RepID=A0A2K3LFC5_TRIPR|nr:putative sulfate transporter [Trifolium pratense]
MHDRIRSGRFQSRYSGEIRDFAHHGIHNTSRHASGCRSRYLSAQGRRLQQRGDHRDGAGSGFHRTRRDVSCYNRYRSRFDSVQGRRLQHGGCEERNRSHEARRDSERNRYSHRSFSSQRRRRLHREGERRCLDDGKGRESLQQNGGFRDGLHERLDYGGVLLEGGKESAGCVEDGSGKIKEVGDGVNAGIKHGVDNVTGSNLKRYVSFYFTNFPAQLPKFFLRKGFEVCGILEDVFVAKKRNRYGQPYGFVKFSNVKNVSKMTNALNNVWFGNFCVKASVAMFERNASRVGRRMEPHKAEMEQVNAPLSQDGKQESLRLEVSKTNGEDSKMPERLSQHKGVCAPRVDMETRVPTKGVRVGDIVVELGARKVNSTYKKAHKEGITPLPPKVELQAATVKDSRCFMKCYRTKSDDVKWANNGVVATIRNGEAVPLVQDRIVDAGFNDLVLIPMGADKVFLRSLAGGDAMGTVDNAKEFFQLFFSNWVRWESDAQPYRRGAWVRLYGIPLHAWNEEFFKLCVLDCGRFLRTDCCSAEKDRLDFARVLIATPDLEIINRVESIMVDGGKVEVKIVEEWGYALGEDFCLVEEESGSETAQSECGEGNVDPEVSRVVDLLINNITEGLQGEACVEVQGFNNVGIFSNVRSSSQDQVVGPDSPSVVVEAQDRLPVRTLRVKRMNSCPPEARRSVISGPWSLEWLNDQNHGDAGVIFSARKKGRKGNRPEASLISKGQQDPLKRKDL